MCLIYISIACVLVAWLIPNKTVKSSRTEGDHMPLDNTEEVKNTSDVYNVLRRVIRNYKKLEKIAKSDSTESDENTDSANKMAVDMDMSNKGRTDIKAATAAKPHVFKGTPIYFSDKSDVETAKRKEYGIKKKTPVLLAADNHMDNKKSRDDTESNADVSLSEEKVNDNNSEDVEYSTEEKGDMKKLLLIHVDKRKPKQVRHRASNEKERHSSIEDHKLSKPVEAVAESHSGEEKEIQSEILKAGYLRQAYADACKQVAVRKCLRALRAVSKDVCSKGRKCTSKYKDDFRTNGQAACDEYFYNSSACRMGADLDELADSLDSKRQRKVLKEQKPKTLDQADEHMNILRDRFEKACKKNSFEKCQKACNDATNKTCNAHECVSAKKKVLKKSCKRRCQESFGYSGGNSDESEEEEEDDDDDE